MTPDSTQQPCSEGCADFVPHPTDSWSDFGRCTAAKAPRRGVVRIGTECTHFRPAGSEAAAADDEAKSPPSTPEGRA